MENLKEINFWDGHQFSDGDVFSLITPHNGMWFDYCPCDGVSDYKTDNNCLCHVRVIDNDSSLLIVSIPNFGVIDMDEYHRHLYINKIVKSEIWLAVNNFNSSRCVYKIGGLELGEEAIFILNSENMLVDVVCNSYNECLNILREFNIDLTT